MHPVFEYDPAKNKKNQERHGIDFEQAQQLWKVPHVVTFAKEVFGEVRYAISGELSGQIYITVFTYRGPVIRLISCHKADLKWQREHKRRIDEA